MDGRQRSIEPNSLQKKINLWIIIACTFFGLFAGIFAGITAFLEAKETQDTFLLQIGELVTHTQISSVTVTGDDPEEPLIVLHLQDKNQNNLPLAPNCSDGFYTLKFYNSTWRTLVITGTRKGNKTPKHFAIAQKTEFRNELAWDSSLNIFLVILFLIPLLIGVIHLIIRRGFKPVSNLAEQLDQRLETDLTPLAKDNIPKEITPFVLSINRLLLRINKVLNQQRRFIADAAHELRTPLTALSLLSENLTRVKNMEQAQLRLIPLQEGMKRMQQLVNQLLSLARMQGQPPSDPHAVNILPIARDIIAELYPLAETKAIDLGMTQQEDITFSDTEDGLSILLRNAISNALHYTPKGGRIDVSIFAKKGQAFLQILDNGPGIPENELIQILEPFRRVKGNREPGNGLGLAISNEIAVRLGGEIKLKNHSQGGLVFIYCQPLSINCKSQ